MHAATRCAWHAGAQQGRAATDATPPADKSPNQSGSIDQVNAASGAGNSSDQAPKKTSRAGDHGDDDEKSPAARLMKLARGSKSDEERPKYRPRTAQSLARRRMLSKMLPYDWQKGARNAAEAIPEQYFTYILSTLSIAASSLIGGTLAYFGEPWLKELIIKLFSAATPEARVMQVRQNETQQRRIFWQHACNGAHSHAQADWLRKLHLRLDRLMQNVQSACLQCLLL